MFTPRTLVNLARIAALVGGAGLVVLMLGPFQGMEQRFGLTDKEAHAMAFFTVTAALFCIAPTWRRTDLALAALAFGVIIEMGQALTGRSMSLADLAADAVGIGFAVAPGMIERLRRDYRKYADLSYAEIRGRDRRRTRKTQRSTVKLTTR